MKTKAQKFQIATAIFLLATGIYCSAQNPQSKESKTVKVLTDTTFVEASIVTFAPGEKGPLHTHPAYFIYALTDCHLVVHHSDGKVEKVDVSAGDNAYSNPEGPHWTENAGDKPAKFLIVELKEHPYKTPMAK